MQRSILGAVAVLALAAAPASAQDMASARAFRLGVRAGASVPIGNLAESGEDGGNASTGFNVAGSLAFSPAALPFGVRVELGYDRFGVDLDDFGGDASGIDANWNMISGTLNATLPLGSGVGARPYLIGGVGMYRYELKISGDDGEGGDLSVSFDDTDIGVNGGLGLRFGMGGISSFVEARLHHIFAEESLQFVPISFGVEF
jgi:opacity protein-like surface antigen